MPGELFKVRFGKDPKSFSTVTEINNFVEESIGKKLKVGHRHECVCSTAGNVFKLVDRDADSIFEEYIKK